MSTLQSPFSEDGRLDLDVVRSGNYDICEDKQVRAALVDEVEAARADRDLLRAVLAAIDLPDPADADGRDARLELLDLRCSFILGYLGAYLDGGSVERTAERLAEALEHHHPIGYTTDGGESL